jgi:hypothetical protein
VNSGFTDNGFVVVIAGSNGYNKGAAVQDAKKSAGGRLEVTAVVLGVVGVVMAVVL